MSETDDTDDLLLIPPDFFLVTSEPEPPYYNIVNSLITQVGNLRDRIDTIESHSDISLVGSYLDQTLDCTGNMFNSKKYSSSDDIHSTQSTPQKPRTKFKLNSLPASPNVDRFSPKKALKFNASQSRPENPGILNEVDNFISNVKTIQRNHAVRSLNNEFEEVKTDKEDIKEILEDLKKQSQKIEAQNKKREVQAVKDSSWRCGDNVNTVPDYNLGVRNTLYKTDEQIHKGGRQSTRYSDLEHSKNALYKTNEQFNRGDYQPNIYELEPSKNTAYQGSNTKNERVVQSSETTKKNANQKYFGESKNKQISESNKPERLENRGCTYQAPSNTAHYRIDEIYKPLSNAELNSYTSVDRFDSDSSSDSTQMTVFNKLNQNREDLVRSPLHINALNALNMHKKTLDTAQQIRENKISKKRGDSHTISNNVGLLNLADIWGTRQQSPSKMVQKLEEEKIKRQHCEQLIQDLQNKNLELQQKLVVALKVDESKNKTIDQFREGLEKAFDTMEKLVAEKNSLDQEMEKLKSRHAEEMDNATQRSNYYENEMAKALNLAHGNQEKIALLERRCLDLQNELGVIEERFKELRDNYQKEVDKNQQMAEIITQKEIEINKNKVVLNETRNEIANSKKAVESTQKELFDLREECARLQNDLKQEHALTTSLTENKKKIEYEVQIFKNREKSLNDTVKDTKLKLENTKIELRNFYQGQLELILESKIKELQGQLEQERQKYEEEFKRKEMSMAKTAASHIKDISDKCALEIKHLELKHQEEISLFQLQAKHSKKEIDLLQQKLAQLPEKRAQIAKELHKVLESQWSEAIKMIGDTPTSLNQPQPDPPNPENFSRKNIFMDNLLALRQNPQPPVNTLQKTSAKQDVTSDYDETPVSSRGGATKNSESEIQKYINMLLLRDNNTGRPKDFPDEHSQWPAGVRKSKR